jgi:uncharacterized membrane protein YhaH (DUF805 family)
MKWYLKVLRNYAVFKGRARRKEYWMFVLFNAVFLILALIADYLLGFGFVKYDLPMIGLNYVLYAFFVMLPALGVCVRRLHDVGKSGFFMFISFIPIVGGIWLFILFCTPGTVGDNQYGEDPKAFITA